MQHRGNDGRDAKDHDNALNKIIDGGRHIAACNDIDTGEYRHDDDAYGVIDVKRHTEQAAQAIIEACSVRDEEDKNDDRCAKL